jgi:hypothetical protein
VEEGEQAESSIREFIRALGLYCALLEFRYAHGNQYAIPETEF